MWQWFRKLWRQGRRSRLWRPMRDLQLIKAGHKMALVDFQKDDTVIKYGIPIGKMKQDAPKGSSITATM